MRGAAWAVILCAAAGYDPIGMSTFLTSLAMSSRLELGYTRNPTFFDTHPGSEERAAANAVLALGYAGWAPGQLETEIQGNGWLHCPADSELIFGTDTDKKYLKALGKIGIDLGKLSSDVGHA